MNVWRKGAGITLFVLVLGMSLATAALAQGGVSLGSGQAPGPTGRLRPAGVSLDTEAHRIALERYRLVKRLQPRFGFFPLWQSLDVGCTLLFPIGRSDRVYVLLRGAAEVLPNEHGDILLFCYQRKDNRVKRVYRVALEDRPSQPIARVRCLLDYLISFRFAVSAAGNAVGPGVSLSYAVKWRVSRFARADLAARRDYVEYGLSGQADSLVVWLLSDVTDGWRPEEDTAPDKVAFYDLDYARHGLPVPPRELALLDGTQERDGGIEKGEPSK